MLTQLGRSEASYSFTSSNSTCSQAATLSAPVQGSDCSTV